MKHLLNKLEVLLNDYSNSKQCGYSRLVVAMAISSADLVIVIAVPFFVVV